VGENTSQAASVEFVCHKQTNYARGRLQKNWRKSPQGFFDKLNGTHKGCLLPYTGYRNRLFYGCHQFLNWWLGYATGISH